MSNFRFVLSQIKRSIESTQADLVLLQEVVGHHEKHKSRIRAWPTAPQFEYLADRVWPHFAYGKNSVYTHGHHGNAILSKYPILKWENLDISTNRLEKRGLLHAVIGFPDNPQTLHIVCVHLGLFESGRQLQIQQLCGRIQSLVSSNAPLIVGGDFNDWMERASSTLKEQLGLQEIFHKFSGQHAKTFPSWLPVLKLDRIYYRSLDPLSASRLAQGVWNDLSDHVALLAEFKMK